MQLVYHRCCQLNELKIIFENNSLFTTGVITSPNYPEVYFPNLDKTEILQVETGKVLRLEFNDKMTEEEKIHNGLI